MTKLASIKGIGPENGIKLSEVGIRTSQELFEKTRTDTELKEVARKAGLPEELIRQWASWVDLAQIEAINFQTARLLEAVGVASVKELAACQPKELLSRLAEANTQSALMKKLPGLNMLAAWISEAQWVDRRFENDQRIGPIDVIDLAEAELPGDIDIDNKP